MSRALDVKSKEATLDLITEQEIESEAINLEQISVTDFDFQEEKRKIDCGDLSSIIIGMISLSITMSLVKEVQSENHLNFAQTSMI